MSMSPGGREGGPFSPRSMIASPRTAFAAVSTMLDSNESSERHFIKEAEKRDMDILLRKAAQVWSGRLAMAKLHAALLRTQAEERAKRNVIGNAETTDGTRLFHKILAANKRIRDRHRRHQELPPVIIHTHTAVSKRASIAAFYGKVDASNVARNVERMYSERSVADAQRKVLLRMKERMMQGPPLTRRPLPPIPSPSRM